MTIANRYAAGLRARQCSQFSMHGTSRNPMTPEAGNVIILILQVSTLRQGEVM